MTNSAIEALKNQLNELTQSQTKTRKDFDDTLAYIEYLLPLSKLNVRFNILKDRLEIDGKPADYTNLRRAIVKEFGYGLPINERQYVLSWYLQNKPYDPIRAYLDSLPDTAKISPQQHIAKIFKLDETSFDTTLILTNLLGAVYRGYEPGCKMDSVLVLIGNQGQKKSTVFKALMPDEDLFVEPKKQRNDVHDMQVFHQHWFVNMSELGIMFSRKSIEEVKDFITSEKDVMVKPYAPEPKTYYRQFILVGSTNEDELFRDDENRRFHCVKMAYDTVFDIEYAKANRNDLWAGLKQLWSQGVPYYFEQNSPEAELVKERNLLFREESPFAERLQMYLKYHGDKPFKLAHCAEKVLEYSAEDYKKQKQLKTELKALGYESRRFRLDGMQLRMWCHKSYQLS